MNNIINFFGAFPQGGEQKMADIDKSKRLDIDKEKMLAIEERTADLLKDVDFGQSPCVDIVSLVKKDDFEVKPTDMDIETTGCILVNDDGLVPKRLITVNTFFRNPDNESDVIFKKSRFITAHEYGHFILHREQGEPTLMHRDTYHRTEPKELEADYFARSILMPLDQFRVYYELLNDIGNNDPRFTIEFLSKLFKVTRNKVRKRIGDLETLSSEANCVS